MMCGSSWAMLLTRKQASPALCYSSTLLLLPYTGSRRGVHFFKVMRARHWPSYPSGRECGRQAVVCDALPSAPAQLTAGKGEPRAHSGGLVPMVGPSGATLEGQGGLSEVLLMVLANAQVPSANKPCRTTPLLKTGSENLASWRCSLYMLNWQAKGN